MADELHIRCPECGAWRTTPDYTVGLSVACPACGKSISVTPGGDGTPPQVSPDSGFAPGTSHAATLAVHSAFADDSEEEPAPVTAPEPVASDRCAQCQREFRGEWDQVETDAGTICYICSNLATERIPDRVLDKPDPQELKLEPIAPADRADADERNVLFDPKSEQFQKVLLGVALATVTIALIVSVTGYGGSGDSSSAGFQTELAEGVEMPGWLVTLFQICAVSSRYAALGLAIYLTLLLRDGLPHESALRNVIYIGMVVGILLGLRVGQGILWLAVLQHYDSGDIVNVFLNWIIRFGSIAYVLYAFDWRFRDVPIALVVWGLSAGIVWSLLVLVFGGLATLFG